MLNPYIFIYYYAQNHKCYKKRSLIYYQTSLYKTYFYLINKQKGSYSTAYVMIALFLYDVNTYYVCFFIFYACNQLLSGLVISLALLYAISKVKQVLPKYLLLSSVLVQVNAKSGTFCVCKQIGTNNCNFPL